MASKLDPRTRLEAKRERILVQIKKDNDRQSRVFESLGFGYAMRAYSRLKHSSNRRGDELRERLDSVEKALMALGWEDPSKPRPVERTPMQQLAYYCEVMELDFEEELAKSNARQSAQIAH